MDRSNFETGDPLEHEREISHLAPLPVIFTYFGFAACSLVIIASLLEIGSHAVLSIYHHSHMKTGADIAPDDPTFFAFPWARECVEEQPLRLKARDTYFPFRIWGNGEWHDDCINNNVTDLGAVRRTINPVHPACGTQRTANIWVLGGSTVYGTRIPDWGTLPSYLSKQLNTG